MTSTKTLDLVENGKPHKIMHDNGKEFTSKIFRHFLRRDNIKDKSIPARYPQLQGKIEAYNKIVKNEFLKVENILNIEEGKRVYSMFVKSYNDEREHDGSDNSLVNFNAIQLSVIFGASMP